MKKLTDKILLNDVLKLDNLDNVKIRFNIPFGADWNPIELFKNTEFELLLKGQYWNYSKKKSYKNGQITIGFIRLNEKGSWLLFHIGRITKDLDKLDGVGYEFETLAEYEKYFGRIIINFNNKSQTMIRLAKSVINECEIHQMLPGVFDNDIFPGYDQVDVSWNELSRIVRKEGWKIALQNQKGVYLISDISNGKMYVGSAYGENMILGRWKSYIKNGHGGNIGLKELDFDHIKKYFKYSILDIFKSTVDDAIILTREAWWKEALQTKRFGYNKN